MPARRFRTWVLRPLLILLAATGMLVAWMLLFSDNFGIVRLGQLYRSAQLSGATLGRVVREHRIKTVLNLRGSHPESDWYRDERTATLEGGATQVDMPMSSCEWMSRAQARALLEVLETAERLRALCPGVRFAVAHGQMGEGELETVMMDYLQGGADVLVCTSIIESGIDIPQANTLIVEHADAFGLAQLYQIRGRVGRSRERAYAYLLYDSAAALVPEAAQRLAALSDPELRQIAMWRLEGYTNREIADKLDMTESSVERRTERIRDKWLNYDDGGF